MVTKQPNVAHIILAELEKEYDVYNITIIIEATAIADFLNIFFIRLFFHHKNELNDSPIVILYILFDVIYFPFGRMG